MKFKAKIPEWSTELEAESFDEAISRAWELYKMARELHPEVGQFEVEEL